MGATSGATPRVAGAMLLFKDWYLTNHGVESGNNPGRLICNVLNFADGVAYEDHEALGARVSAPAPGHGLGRMRMRLYEPGHMGSSYVRSTKAVSLRTGDIEEFDLSGKNKSAIPSTAMRLRITLWWAEVNTGDGESKARFRAKLFDAGTGEVLYSRENNDSVIRFDFDCNDSLFPQVPRVDLWISIEGLSVPDEVRCLRRDYRSVVVSWFWESGGDLSKIECGDDKRDCAEGDDPAEEEADGDEAEEPKEEEEEEEEDAPPDKMEEPKEEEEEEQAPPDQMEDKSDGGQSDRPLWESPQSWRQGKGQSDIEARWIRVRQCYARRA